jgi:hypothetical protein
MTPERILETRLVAAAPPPPVGHRFTAGTVIAKTMTAWWRHVLTFTALSFVVYAPLAVAFGVFGLAVWSRLPGTQLSRLFAALGGAWILTIVLAVIQAGAVTYGTIRHLSGERATVGEMLRAGIRRGLPIVGVGLLLWIGTALGFLLLVVPGVLLAVAGSVAIPAAVIERPGVIGAIRRSFELTRGRRWPLFAAGLAVLGVVWVLAAAVQVGATVVSAAVLPPQRAAVGMMVGSQLGNALFSALPLVGISVAYHELRAEKEGVDPAALAKVFE